MIYYFLGMNIVAFLLFGIDKKRSIDQKYRIPEKILLGISFLGGSFGSLFGMFYFHHKTKKNKFLFLVPLACLFWTFLLLK